MKEKTKSSKEIYTCHFMTLYEDQVELYNGKMTERVFVDHPGAAAILPITKDGNIILTRQFRYPIKEVSIEIPAGKKDDIHEDPKHCAARELEEETGHMSDHLEHFITYYPCLGYSNEVIDIFIAYDCIVKENPKAQDDDEHVEIIILSLKEIEHMIKNQDIKDGKTIMAIQKYMLLTQNK
ncbi:MAG: NUDIX hydrolase [Acholeplasmataceae bacterium]|jgi:ADP-ribose pyrophosphatase|nr:NUDIX hydrolase [Acholeplasmataceae bacterium]